MRSEVATVSPDEPGVHISRDGIRVVPAKPPKAPTSHEESTLPCTHICCDSCDYAEPWHASRPAGEWSCPWCGDRSPVFEHWSDRPLGFRDDKACSWGPVRVPPPSTAPPNFRGHVLPEQWVYKAAVPGEPTT